MEEKDRQAAGTPGEPTQHDDAENGVRTRAGQIVQELARVTKPLPPAVDHRVSNQVATAALRDRIASLITALGDTTHPLHQRAIEDLVTIGPAAVPQLCEALNPQRPWLTTYRAAEALGRIGDGRAAGPLLDALRSPNNNVRWSAIRALATVGDARALLELRRVARTDQGKTSWGESVGGVAQSVLDQMQGRNVLLRGADLIKTAVACVAMLVALILAWTFVTALRDELRTIGQAEVNVERAPIVRTALPTIPQPTAALPANLAAQPTIQISPTAPLQPNAPSVAPDAITATVIAGGNVRALPTRAANNVIGGVSEGDEVIVLATTNDQQWYRIALGARHAAGSRINTPTQTGWVARSLLSPISGQVPVENTLPTPLPTAPAAPTPEPPLAPPTLTPSP
ncbi:MAG: SH3 domain-containing protein [Roseiflexaceae bacterium]|nr:SH3 domain-containing protein [Roseiflexaceae bacterium]